MILWAMTTFSAIFLSETIITLAELESSYFVVENILLNFYIYVYIAHNEPD